MDQASSLAHVIGNLTPNMEIIKARQTMKQLVNIPWAQSWEFLVEADGMPPTFDLYVKDISYGTGTVQTEPKQIGAGEFNKPTHLSAETITMTVRDDESGTVEKWFEERKSRVCNRDGTVNLPRDYVFTIRIYKVSAKAGKVLESEYLVFATERGAVTRSRDQVSEFFSYPITFTKYTSFDAFGVAGIGQKPDTSNTDSASKGA
ncbi:MAG TPA: phage tail protein [Buttiauxella sp.]|jgi:hypothetical protein